LAVIEGQLYKRCYIDVRLVELENSLNNNDYIPKKNKNKKKKQNKKQKTKKKTNEKTKQNKHPNEPCRPEGQQYLAKALPHSGTH
jgi:hypothetical protein